MVGAPHHLQSTLLRTQLAAVADAAVSDRGRRRPWEESGRVHSQLSTSDPDGAAWTVTGAVED